MIPYPDVEEKECIGNLFSVLYSVVIGKRHNVSFCLLPITKRYITDLNPFGSMSRNYIKRAVNLIENKY